MPGNGTNIYQKARKEAQMTQEQAAEALYISEKTVKAWEQGQRVPDNEAVGRMAELYRTPWLALAHALETAEPLGVLPEGITLQGLPSAVLVLINRATALADGYRRLMQIAEDGVIDESEQPDFAEISDDIREVIAAGFQVLYAPAPPGIALGQRTEKDRPVGGTTKRSGFRAFAENDSKVIISHRRENTSPNLARGGGVLP